MAKFETERLVLRPVSPADHDALRTLVFDPQVVAYLRYRLLKTEADFEQAFTDHFLADATTVFALETKADHQFVGFYEFHVTETTGILTYALLQSAWGHGYVAEAGRALMGYAFNTLGLTHLEAHYAHLNPNSGRVMAKMGMREAGELHTKTLDNGQVVHVMKYVLDKGDWNRAQSQSA
ncbi:GNAT family N-acetyltransferase [Lactiplantibacillus modestisalitolerans]|uniref:GNAT family N-acetyltransferase n=1 Tax=Lactiplantibacillus modestisalitolerans TaxID=1457219 RepID=A0ABV5WR38_9LACO|nr:GNAT family N-acetyltransferase [Lactiplantibacillus modestisalitolerans]